MTHTTLIQTRSNRWEDKNNKENFIWRDDFGQFIIFVNGVQEVAKTLEKALTVFDCDRYWN